MKRLILLSFAFLFAGSLGFSQQPVFEVESARPVNVAQEMSAAKVSSGRDTIWDYTDRATGYTIYGATGGYVFGLNDDGQGNPINDEIGLHFDGVGAATVVEVYSWIGAKQIVGAPDNLECKLWAVGPDSLPSQLLGFGTANMAFVDSSSTVTFSNFNGFQPFSIDQGSAAVTGPFLVSLSFAGNDDTLGLVSNVQGDGFQERRAKMFLSQAYGAAWINMSDFWNLSGTPLDADPIIVPVLELAPTALEEGFNSENLQFFPAYPNPAMDQTTLRYTLSEADEFQVRVIDSQGRLVWDSGSNFESAGEHSLQLDLRGWAAGKYYYTVSTSKASVTSRFMVIK